MLKHIQLLISIPELLSSETICPKQSAAKSDALISEQVNKQHKTDRFISVRFFLKTFVGYANILLYMRFVGGNYGL